VAYYDSDNNYLFILIGMFAIKKEEYHPLLTCTNIDIITFHYLIITA